MAQRTRKIVGLMSGTSADGVDAALVGISGSGTDTALELLGFEFAPYSDELRREVLEISGPDHGTVDRVCRMHSILGEWFAKAAQEVCTRSGVPMTDVDLIGSHGQTVQHLPDPVEAFGVRVRSTLQIGDPSVIAERTGVTTVADFRARDVAAGGQGAPLVPLVDYLLFRSDRLGRVMLNLGGIANVTVLPPGCGPEDVIAFDTGPGNMVIDALAMAVTRGAQSQDVGGELAARGQVSGKLLDRLKAHPFLRQPPPKSTGREAFGAAFAREMLEADQALSGPDVIRTATAFTGESVCDALRRFVFPACAVHEMMVSGGGTENPVLMGILGEKLHGVRVGRIDELGIPPEAKEAVAFAVLANEALAGHTGSLTQVTGADRPVVLGTIVPGRGCRFRVDPDVGLS